jgi:hypothetical protein
MAEQNPLPVVESIALALLASAKLITKQNGYFGDAKVRRARKIPASPADYQINLMQSDPILDPDPAPNADQQTAWICAFGFLCFIRHGMNGESDEDSIDARYNLIIADVTRAVLVSPTCGGLVHGRLRILPPLSLDKEETGVDGKVVVVAAPYRVNTYDPRKRI